MKIKKIITTQNKLFNLKLLKTKNYTKLFFYNIKIKTIKLSLKKSLDIIYKFHTTNKKILFIGTPLKKNKQIKKLLKNTKHTFLPEKMWVNGAMSNSSSIIRHLFKKQKLDNFKKKKPKLKFKYNLIVFIKELSNESLLKELLFKQIPIISLSNNANFNSATYKTLGNFYLNYKQKSQNNYFFTILNNIFKKAKKK